MAKPHRKDFEAQGKTGEHGHEPTDLRGIRPILVAGAVLVSLCLGVLFFLGWAMRGYQADERAREESRPPLFVDDRGQFPTPRLQENPNADLVSMRKADAATLAGYGWADRKAGIATIPVERAMEIVARKGLPQPGSHPVVEEELKPEAKPPASTSPEPESKSAGPGRAKSQAEIPASGDAKSKEKPGGGG